MQKGHVRVELYDLKKTTFIIAHEANLSCIELNSEGTLLATASEKGTLVRIFNTNTGDLLQELRRGVDKAEIYSISFHPASLWLALSSDKGTIHIFSLKNVAAHMSENEEKAAAELEHAKHSDDTVKGSNPTSSLSFFKSILPKYFSSEWSFAQYRVNDSRSLVAFGSEKNSIIVISSDGSYFKALFDPEAGGECIQQSTSKFMKGQDDE